MIKSIVFIDTEVSQDDEKINDFGAVTEEHNTFHSPNVHAFLAFIADSKFVCGHNIIKHDIKYLEPYLTKPLNSVLIDTLYLSPLLFPFKPYHKLVKDDKLQSDQLNNPLNDAEKAQQLFNDEVNAFYALNSNQKQIYCCLLYQFEEFKGFFDYVKFAFYGLNVEEIIRDEFKGEICEHADLSLIVKNYPRELAYALALISTADYHSITPPWLEKNFPFVGNVIRLLRNVPCETGCLYCNNKLNIHTKLKTFFGFDEFRSYEGEPLQENAVQAAINGKSLLAVFPTGGGKSLTFQLPALIQGESVHGLTVIISPLQSLMKDQVDNLNDKGIVDAVTINGLLNPIERMEAIERVRSGLATLLYISPEQLRSPTIEKILYSRNIVRFVIDEAHCFSAWGQDFRVDYLYIGDFICELNKHKQISPTIPISCFTATAKQKVITDICDYFKIKLNLNLELYTTTADRENLHYKVLYEETEEDKYIALRNLIEQKNCSTIVYVSRVKKTIDLADKLTKDGFIAKPYNGPMDAKEKTTVQEAFMKNEIKIIVATSAFGMGVDKKDVKLVVHYDISNSLENYIQEAGRAGRDPSINADCYVLFNDSDLDRHFMTLNQTKLSLSEIQQVWRAVKQLTRERKTICCSPLEVARQAGWDDTVQDIEGRVKTALAALENANYIKRGINMPHVFATSIRVKNMEEATNRINESSLFTQSQREMAQRIMKSLISSRSHAKAGNDLAESRIDYLSDILGIEKSDIIEVVNSLRQEGLLADSKDMSTYIFGTDTENRSAQTLERFAKLERFLIFYIDEAEYSTTTREMNEAALNEGITFSSTKRIKTLLYFMTIKNYVIRQTTWIEEDGEYYEDATRGRLVLKVDKDDLLARFDRRIDICNFVVSTLYERNKMYNNNKPETLVEFSLIELFSEYQQKAKMDLFSAKCTIEDMEDALLYLSKIGALKLEGGFLVLYNGMRISRIEDNSRAQYKIEEYKNLAIYYKQKMQQIHIVGEFANLMVKDYDKALQFVHDYFQMDYKMFIDKYFRANRARDIERNITPSKSKKIFGDLSPIQSTIINDNDSKYIVVAAGPGSGKTRVLVHKLASLLLLEDVKHEQLLMLTFSRAAATEFKKRLIDLIGSSAYYVEIKTFHSYCFDLMGKIGSLDSVKNVISDAAEMIDKGEVEEGKITKSVLVIDEAQDMDDDDVKLLRSLMKINEDMRVIAVGDDDQNIFEFRGSNSKFMRTLISEYGAKCYDILDNYRSKPNIVALANQFATTINSRMKRNQISAVQKENGLVQIFNHSSENLEEPIVKHIKAQYRSGSTCVLTATNIEALRVMGLLRKNGIRALLIQATEKFRLYDLAEVRYFLQCIDESLKTPVISPEILTLAKNKLTQTYKDSRCLTNCLNMIATFKAMNQNNMYRSALDEFIMESTYDDFYPDAKETIYISTIHKSKGREFDNVYVMLNKYNLNDDKAKRELYVGLTRAKTNLFIHCNNQIFSNYNIPGVSQYNDTRQYNIPEEVTIHLTHSDVNLGFYKDKKEIIMKQHSGQELSIVKTYLKAKTGGLVAMFSKGFVETLEGYKQKGYEVCGANVLFTVYWKGKEDVEETLILLPELHLRLKK